MKVIFPKQSQGISRGKTRLGPWWRDRRRRYRGPGGNPCCIFLHGGGVYIGCIHCSFSPMPTTFRPSPCSGCPRYSKYKVTFTYNFFFLVLSCTLRSVMLKTYFLLQIHTSLQLLSRRGMAPTIKELSPEYSVLHLVWQFVTHGNPSYGLAKVVQQQLHSSFGMFYWGPAFLFHRGCSPPVPQCIAMYFNGCVLYYNMIQNNCTGLWICFAHH